MFHTSALNNIYYEIRLFCKVILIQIIKKMLQCFNKNNLERFYYGVKTMVCDKKCENIAKIPSLLI